MNRLAWRVMAAVAGMAVVGMTATLAGAQNHPATHTLGDVMQAPFASDGAITDLRGLTVCEPFAHVLTNGRSTSRSVT
ncbi:MAG TPA: hypothetical protein VFM10_11695 [Terriglobales bacterium]|nr:hypothetical protein [Terriglobales bacterium]